MKKDKLEPNVNESATFMQANEYNFSLPINQTDNQKDFSDLTIQHPASTDDSIQFVLADIQVPTKSQESV